METSSRDCELHFMEERKKSFEKCYFEGRFKTGMQLDDLILGSIVLRLGVELLGFRTSLFGFSGKLHAILNQQLDIII